MSKWLIVFKLLEHNEKIKSSDRNENCIEARSTRMFAGVAL